MVASNWTAWPNLSASHYSGLRLRFVTWSSISAFLLKSTVWRASLCSTTSASSPTTSLIRGTGTSKPPWTKSKTPATWSPESTFSTNDVRYSNIFSSNLWHNHCYVVSLTSLVIVTWLFCSLRKWTLKLSILGIPISLVAYTVGASLERKNWVRLRHKTCLNLFIKDIIEHTVRPHDNQIMLEDLVFIVECIGR